MALHSQVPDAKSIAFVSMGTGVYKWPMALAADIAVKALLTSTFQETLMCVMDDKTRLIYQSALDRYLSAKFLQKIFRGLLTTQYIYPTALRRHTFPLWSIWNLVFKLSSGTLPQNVGAWASMLAKHGSRPSPITPWSYNGRILWNIQDESPWLVTHDSRLVHQRSCLAVRCSSSRFSSASPSTGLCSV